MFNIVYIRTFKIGRNPDKTDITISEGTISRIHAEFDLSSDEKLYIKDLESGIEIYFKVIK